MIRASRRTDRCLMAEILALSYTLSTTVAPPSLSQDAEYTTQSLRACAAQQGIPQSTHCCSGVSNAAGRRLAAPQGPQVAWPGLVVARCISAPEPLRAPPGHSLSLSYLLEMLEVVHGQEELWRRALAAARGCVGATSHGCWWALLALHTNGHSRIGQARETHSARGWAGLRSSVVRLTQSRDNRISNGIGPGP